MSRTLIIGGSGQIGKCLQDEVPANEIIIAPQRTSLNLNSPERLYEKLEKISPSAIINCSGYTNVDKAESDEAKAYCINSESPKVMAYYSAEMQIPFIHLSTDFVFDGDKSKPYQPADTVNPINTYGESKLSGEQEVRSSNSKAYIVRTSWVYSEYGNNFILRMIKLAKRNGSLSVVTDQIGSPCYARNLAKALWKLLEIQPEEHLFHYANEGSISKQELITAVIYEAYALKLIDNLISVDKALTKDFPLPARRPAYSSLDSSLICKKLAIEPIHWSDALRHMMAQLVTKNTISVNDLV
jgi:dTDP-4-dehydrorhamnose reductase